MQQIYSQPGKSKVGILSFVQIEIKPYSEEFRAGYNHLRSIVYRNGEPIDPEEELIDPSLVGSVGLVNGKVVAGCVARKMTCTWFGDVMPCAGVASVGVLPEFRGSGIGSALMREVLPLYVESGFEIASLYPFRSRFYHKFGYAHAGSRYKVSVKPDTLPPAGKNASFRLLPVGDFSEIKDCYRKFAHQFNGMNLRTTDKEWWRCLGGDRPLHVYAFGDPVEAYVALRIKSDFWVDVFLEEVVWSSGNGYKALYSLFAALGLNKSAIAWYEPHPSIFFTNYADHGSNAELMRLVQYRVLEIEPSLRRLRSSTPGEVSIKITDPVLKQNEAIWNVRTGESFCEINKRNQDPDLVMSVGSFTQAFLGEPDIESLIQSGQIELLRPEKLDFLKQLFRSRSVYCADFF